MIGHFLLAAPDALFEWRDVGVEYIGFLAAFATLGAVGFRYGVLAIAAREPLGGNSAGPAYDTVIRSATTTAAVIGLIGAVLGIAKFLGDVAGDAAEHSQTIAQFIAEHVGRSGVPLALLAVAALAFGAASRRVPGGWPVAAVAAVAFAVRNLASGKAQSMVNPLHILAASLWLGTLAVLMIAALPAALRPQVPSESRGPIVARLVGAFSPLALGSAALLAVTGVLTAWRHLKFLSALWTTPYGVALDCKLVVVACVVALGWWNWQRVRPICGTEPGARQMQTSAARELMVTGVVLAITAVLVSLPTPKLPH